jgi:hypothetical protein
MPFIKLQFKPGVNRDQTDYSNEGGWYECDKIRFRSGYPEKIGGWAKATTNIFVGVCRQMWNWVTTFSDDFLALGTNEKVYIETGGYYYNITPLRTTTPTFTSTTTDNCITLTLGSPVVTVTLPVSHGLTTGDYVQISGVVGPLLGIPSAELNGNYKVTVVSPTVFTYTVATAAGGAASLDMSFITGASGTYGFEALTGGMGGTAITIACEISPGNAITVAGLGWGVGTWGRDSWGLGTTGSGIFLPQRDWWFDNFDNDLVMNIRNGEGFWWVRGTLTDPATALATRAIRLVDYADNEGFDPAAVPVQIMQLLVSQQDRHLVAFGAVPFGSTSIADFDPMLIRWADQDTPGDWTPTVTNTAGDIRVSRGSKIVRALPTRQEILVWTDTTLYTLQFLGTSDVFGLQEYADNISIASPRAVATAANITYWMGQDKFYAYTGRVETLPCTLRNHVFNNINLNQSAQIICGTNEQWNEVWWFYPTADSDFNNAYVVYNHLERIWYYGTIDRTAWLDTPLRQVPQAANTSITVDGNTVTTGSGFLYNHETGLNDDGAPMDSYIQSSDFDLDDGDNFMMTRRILPDLQFAGSTAAAPEVTLQMRPRNFPGGAVYSDPADTQRVIETTVGRYTDQVFVRARARQMAIKIRSENLNVQWQLGAPRLDVRPDGRR